MKLSVVYQPPMSARTKAAAGAHRQRFHSPSREVTCL
jgi:hypothetical protein